MSLMKAVVIERFGDCSVLEPSQVETPELDQNDVLIKVNVAGVNHVDLDIRAGISGIAVKLPHILGVDAAGTIVDVGNGVSNFNIGDRVIPHFELACGNCRNCISGRENICLNFGILGGTCWGTYAEYVKVQSHHLMRIPDGLNDIDAVAAFIPFATCWEAMMTNGKLVPGETVLINAAGSGVGTAGLQIAQMAGCRIIATAGSNEKLQKARELGADITINYQHENTVDAIMQATAGIGVNLALDMVGGEVLINTIKSMAPGGRIVSVGAHAGEKVEIDFIELFRKHIAIFGCGRSTRAVGEHVLDLVTAGKLKPVIERVLPLNDAAQAHQLLEDRACFGRLLLELESNS
jgi:NADPH:quinone reductase-like Zn-dependent oxidoreductase